MKLKDYFILFVKGAIIGIANIIPGVSGGTLAVSLSIYEMLLDAIGNFFKNIKKNIKILIPIVLGAGVGIVSSSKIITEALNKYSGQTIMFFIGLILGGLSLITKKIKGKKSFKNIMIFIIIFILVLSMNYIPKSNIALESINAYTIIKLFLIGILAAGTMVIPGVSGSLVLMLIGYYEPITKSISSLVTFNDFKYNISILVPFGIGAVAGIILVSKVILYLIKRNEITTYFGILGFILASIIVLIMQINNFTFNFINIISSLFLFSWGYLLSKNLEKE